MKKFYTFLVTGIMIIYFLIYNYAPKESHKFYKRDGFPDQGPDVTTDFKDSAELKKYVIELDDSVCPDYFLKDSPCPMENYQNQNDRCHSEEYITAHCRGRFGNQVCLIATLLFLQNEFNVPIAFSEAMYNYNSLIDHFETVETIPFVNKCKKTKLEVKSYRDTYRYLERKRLSRNCSLHLSKSLEIYKCPCPKSFFMQRRPFFRKHLQIREKLKTDAALLLDKIKYRNGISDGTPLVSVHARRGDIEKYLNQKRGLKSASISFYMNAFDYFRKRLGNVAFIVFSDDIDWCIENLQSQKDVFFSERGQPYSLDFVAITLCDHHIISDGTFGFSSAVLGRGLVAFHPLENLQDPVPESKNKYACPYHEEFIPITSEDLAN